MVQWELLQLDIVIVLSVTLLVKRVVSSSQKLVHYYTASPDINLLGVVSSAVAKFWCHVDQSPCLFCG